MLKTAFLQNISHEIRTPMNGIVGFINLLKTPGLTGEEQLEYLDIIVSSSDRMLNTLSDLLDISKLETGQVELVTTTLNINKNLDDLCEDVQPEIESRGLQLNCNTALPEKEAIIITDQYKLNAILTNLLNNALKYTHKGSIDIGYTKKNDKLEFYVKDTGIGIPKDRLKAIFDRFVQADVEKIKVHEGSGLGLSISKSYVEMLGGSIWVESELDIGSQFYFTIPYPTVKPSNSKSGKPMRKLKILIAENEESADKYFTVALNHISSSILHAINGLEAVEVCRNNPDLDLILMDIRMPKLNGYAASQKIREFNEDVIIIAQTADTLGGDYDKSIAAGCDDYITKPINKKELMDMIEKLVSG